MDPRFYEFRGSDVQHKGDHYEVLLVNHNGQIPFSISVNQARQFREDYGVELTEAGNVRARVGIKQGIGGRLVGTLDGDKLFLVNEKEDERILTYSS